MCLRRMLQNDHPEQLSFVWDYEFSDGIVSSESTLRFASNEKIIGLAAQAGLSQIDCFGDWTQGPFLSHTSQEMVFVFGPKQIIQ